MRRRQLLAALLAVAGTSSLAGCSGWYLRGTRKNVLGEVKRIFVSTPTRNLLYSYFITELVYINVSIVPDRSQADVVVELSEERYERRVLSVDPDTGKVREVEVTLSTQIAVRAKDGSLISAPETFRWTEDFVFDEGSLLGTVEVEQNLRVEMAKAAGRALVLKLETIDFTRQGKNAD
jgi:outer membrane lipopolysaccharide assembly protein LptE/RlpB